MAADYNIGLMRSAANIEHPGRPGHNAHWGGWGFYAAEQAMEILGVSVSFLTDDDLADARRHFGQRAARMRLAKPTAPRPFWKGAGAAPSALGRRIFSGGGRLILWEAMFDSGRRGAIIADGQVIAPDRDAPPARR